MWLTLGLGPLLWRPEPRSFDLAAKAEDALDVAGQTALALLLHLVIQRWEGHVVESKVEEQGLARDWLEVRGELDQIGLLPNQSRVKAEGVQAVAQGLRGGASEKVNVSDLLSTLNGEIKCLHIFFSYRVVFHLLLRGNFSSLISV